MNKLIKDSLVPAIVTTLIAFIFNIIVTYSTRTDIIIHVGEAVKVKGEYQLSVSFFNQGKKDIHKLDMILPVDIELSDIYTSDPILIRPLTGGGQNSYEIGGVSKSQRIQMTLFFQNDVDPEKLNFLSPDMSVVVNQFDKMEAPGTKEIRSASVMAVVFLLIFLVFNVYFKREFTKLEESEAKRRLEFSEEREKLKKEINDDNDKFNQKYNTLVLEHEERAGLLDERAILLTKKLDQMETRSSKARIIHARRISEYKKELSYWRDTVRKIIYNAGRSEREANRMLEQISVNLKTFQTQKEDHDINTLMLLEEMYAYNRKED